MNEREDSRGAADTDSEREDGRGCEGARRFELAERVPQLTQKSPHGGVRRRAGRIRCASEYRADGAVAGVMVNGRWLSKADIDARLAGEK